MIIENLIIGLILAAIGTLQVFFPWLLLRFQTWQYRVFLGAKFEPTERTARILRITGSFFLVLGVLLALGLIGDKGY